MYTGSELAHQIPSVARNAQRSPKYLRARLNESKRPANPYTAVAIAIVIR